MSKSKAKGTAFETAIVRYLTECGAANIERRALTGALDRGDISGIVGVVVEAKCVQRTELAAWIDEAEQERINAKAAIAVVVHKRKGKGHVGDQFATMRVRDLVNLLAEANRFVWLPEKGQVVAW